MGGTFVVNRFARREAACHPHREGCARVYLITQKLPEQAFLTLAGESVDFQKQVAPQQVANENVPIGPGERGALVGRLILVRCVACPDLSAAHTTVRGPVAPGS